MTTTSRRWGAMIGCAGSGTRFRPELERPDAMDWLRRAMLTPLDKGASVVYLHNLAGHPPGQEKVTSAFWTACPFKDEALGVIEAVMKAHSSAELWVHASVYIADADPRLGYVSPSMPKERVSKSTYKLPQHQDFWKLQLSALRDAVGLNRLRVVADEGGSLGMYEYGMFALCLHAHSTNPVCEAVPMMQYGRHQSWMPDWLDAQQRHGPSIIREGHADAVGLPSAVPEYAVGSAWLSLEYPVAHKSAWSEKKQEQWYRDGWNVISADPARFDSLVRMCKTA